MSYHIVFYGNETLRQVAEEVANINQDVIDLIDVMFNIMHKERGIGLAAPQIDVSQRILGIDLESYKGPVLALVNPQIIETSGDLVAYEEGCLSVPGIMRDIDRPDKILVKGITPDEKEVEFEADGLLARVLQHEIDHLNGTLFIDHLESFERNELRKNLKKIKKMNKAS
ncbi:MAG TPA: peptide deformylase [Spirochaetota bacterium]|nr:peptide deformylase [Spirochaetota bacterium]HQO02028.1 peptide deformylase [Spirochaetota bacterium]